MKMTDKDRSGPLIKKRREINEKSLKHLSSQHGIPVGTLKTRVKKYLDMGLDRERAIELALFGPFSAQSRPRQH
ncbi:hypothetical protein [Salinicola avicenniae]|uniref:hypothetical protein n=1 Tax=Salinicola avicenniae TaxID=2916836 RepID=UPI002074A949|nr:MULTISPECIES: hypothetical protein [unclassified Salinicola]